MRWFEYHQNNSGGSFNKEMGYTLWVEADDPLLANNIAEEHGVYFNGCDNGYDCTCCGDRWHAKMSSDEGDEKPSDNTYAASWGLENKVIPFGSSKIISYKEWLAAT